VQAQRLNQRLAFVRIACNSGGMPCGRPLTSIFKYHKEVQGIKKDLIRILFNIQYFLQQEQQKGGYG
jgi:hypothetical protein